MSEFVSVKIKLSDQQKRDMARFFETCEDSQDYDIPKDRMKSLARIGMVRSLGFSRYEFTDAGDSVIDELRAVLAQEAGHVEEPLGMVEPTAWLLDGSVGGSSLDFQITDLLETQNRHGGCLVPLFRVPPAPVSVDIESAARKLASCMDYPWEHMPEQGRESMREHAKTVISAAHIDKVKELNQ
jgi:hypothetical protein